MNNSYYNQACFPNTCDDYNYKIVTDYLENGPLLVDFSNLTEKIIRFQDQCSVLYRR